MRAFFINHTHLLTELLRSGLPNEMDDIDLPIVETIEKDKIKQNGQNSKKDDIVQEIHIKKQSLKKLENNKIENNMKEVEDNMSIDIEETLSQNHSENNNDTENVSLSTAEDKSSYSLSGQTTPKDDWKVTNTNGEITKERIESSSSMQIDSIEKCSKQTTDYYSRLLSLSKKRPSYIPEWLPPLPEVKSREDNEPMIEVKKVEAEEKTKELSGLTESTITENEKPFDNMITSQESIPEIQESNNVTSDSNVQVKPSKQKLKRPLAYTMLDESFEKAFISESVLGESISDSPRKRRKIVEFDNLLSFEDPLFSEPEIPIMDDKNTRDLVESYGYPLRLNETPIQKHRSVELSSKINADVNLKMPVQIIDTILTEVKPSKPLQIKSPVSHKGKEKMIPEIIDFQEPEPSTESSKAPKKKEPKNIKAKKSTYKGTTTKSSVPEKTSESNRPKLTLRIKSATTPSDPEPSEVINCICEPPNNTLDDGKFMVSCDNCQEWFHGVCTGFGPHRVEVGTWFCPRCRDRSIS